MEVGHGTALRLLCAIAGIATAGCSVDLGKLRGRAFDGGAEQPKRGLDADIAGMLPDARENGQEVSGGPFDVAIGAEVGSARDVAFAEGDAAFADEDAVWTDMASGRDGDDSSPSDVGVNRDVPVDAWTSVAVGDGPQTTAAMDAEDAAQADAMAGLDEGADTVGQDMAPDAMAGDMASRDVATFDVDDPDASTLQTGLVGRWAFDESSGNMVQDSSGSGMVGTLVNGPTWRTTCAPSKTSSENPSCLHFDGINQSVTLADVPASNFSGVVSLAAWVNTDASRTGFRDIIVHGFTNNPSAEVYLRMQDNAYAVGSFDGRDHQATSNTGASDVGVWVHIAGVYDGKAWRLYRNGRLEASVLDATGAVKVGVPWTIGGGTAGTGRYFNGSIDDVRLYNRALTATEVALLATAI
jgi:type 1 fimbria pilin